MRGGRCPDADCRSTSRPSGSAARTDCYCVDKTGYAARLIEQSTHYFLSRPRRFGKSLFVDTLKELFEGDEALFRDLAVHGHRDWSVRHPVLRLSFGGGLSGTGRLARPWGWAATIPVAALAALF